MTYVINFKGVKCMQGTDRRGPMNAGPMTGRGLGYCTGARPARYGTSRGMGPGLGLACRRGFGRAYGMGYEFDEANQPTDKDILEEQKAILQERLEAIEKELEDM